MHLGKLEIYFPDEKCVHVVRDPRAVISTQLNSVSSGTGHAMALGPYSAARKWQRLQRQIKLLPSERCLTLSYEEIVKKYIAAYGNCV